MIKLVVGLGNPGKKYEETRHNVGFRILDVCADRAGVSFKKESKWESEIAQWNGITFMKPQTFMNDSGRAVGSYLRFYRWKPEEVLIVFDDVALPLGHLRFRLQGGAGGHNGIRSLIAHLSSEEMPRLKVGIGAASGDALVGHVLGRFSTEERESVENTLARAADAVQLACSGGIEAAANEFNTRKKPKPKSTTENEPELRGSDCSEDPGQ